MQEVRLERVAPRTLAAIHATVPKARLGASIIALLDRIWPVLRARSVRTGHNVVIYRGGDATTLTVDVGVEAFSDFAATGDVRLVSTPAGEVATIAHYGDYGVMAPSYAALERWCDEHGRRRTGVSWEVYGDWEDDPAKRRTDLFWLLA